MQWDVGPPSSEDQILEVIEGEPAISTRRLVAGTSTSHAFLYLILKEQQFYPHYIKPMQVTSNDEPARCPFCQLIFNSRPKALHLQQRFYLLTNLLSLRLRSPTFTTNTCGQVKIVMRFDLTISNDSSDQPMG
jgi:hypothetical protein